MFDPASSEPEVPFPYDGDNIVVYQSWWNYLPLAVVAVTSCLVCFYLSVTTPQYAYFVLASGTEIPIAALISLLMVTVWVYLVMNSKLVLTPEYILFITGIISWRQRSIRLEYGHIQEIEIAESLFQRLFGLGDLLVIPLVTGPKSSIRMRGIAHPRLLKDLLRYRQHKSPPPVVPSVENS